MVPPSQAPAGPPEEAQTAGEGRIRRRELLVAGGLLTAAGAIASFERQASWFERTFLRGGTPPSLTLRMLRPADQLAFDLQLYNLKISGSPPRLERIASGDAFVVVVFGGQMVLEETFIEADKPKDSEPTDNPPVRSYLAGASRVAFKVPSSVSSIPFTDEALLEWSERLTPSLAPNATGSPGSPRPQQSPPDDTVTGIEVPAGLTLSPGPLSAWVHSTAPVTSEAGRTELWHTRLAGKTLVPGPLGAQFEVVENREGLNSLRAIYSESWQPTPPQRDGGFPFGKFNDVDKASITDKDRSEIVSLTSDFGLGSYSPRPIRAKHFMLSSQGAWTDMRADFPAVQGFSKAHFSHRSTMGREHFVKVVDRGFLWPFGHQAVLIKITERKFEPMRSGLQSGRSVAYLRKRVFVVVTEREREYDNRKFPFDRVEILTDRTPNLDGFGGKAGVSNGSGLFGEGAFWPVVGGEDFVFDLIGTDAEGVLSRFSTPLIFVDKKIAEAPSNLKKIRSAHTAADAQRRTPLMGGQSIAYAPPSEGKSRDTAFETSSMEFGGEVFGVSSPKFYPAMRSAAIRVPALAQVAAAGEAARRRRARESGEEYRGGAEEIAGTVLVEPAKQYVKDGFDEAKNQAQAYLKLAEAEALDYAKDAAADACGAIGVPNMDVVGLSRSVGTIGGKLLKGELPDLSEFKPADFLAGAKFLGIDFKDVLEEAIGFPLPDVPDITKVPQQLTETVYDGIDQIEGAAKELENRIPKEIRTELLWEPDLQANKSKIFIPNNDGENAFMRLHSLTVVPIQQDLSDPIGEPQVEVTGELTNFTIQIFGEGGFLLIYFNRFIFETRNGQKPKIDIDIRDVGFAGALEFVNELRDLMSYSGNGLTIDVGPSGVNAAYSLEVPTITAGIFTLANIALNASASVPFDGKPVRVAFGFCSEEDPFLLTYTIFGGGGYALVEANANDGIERLTVSLEFGAAASIDLGVASGSVQIMAGTTISVGPNPLKGQQGEPDIAALLTGFVRLNGELDVLGLINVSLEFNLSLTYDSATEEAWGRAVLTIEVDVAVFSESVEIECEKRFGGGKASGSALNARAERGGSGGSELDADPISFEQIFPPIVPDTPSSGSNDWNTYVGAFAQEAF